jgi:hypothetical protein
MQAAGAHYAIDTLPELSDALDDIDVRLKAKKPGG